MPTPPSDEPLQKITINIYASDYEKFKRWHGQGWSIVIRNALREWIKRMEKIHGK